MSATTEPIRVEPGDHVVHFYRDDAELAETVGAQIAWALREGAAAVAITTEAHAAALERELDNAGADVEGARADGRLIVLDASATLARLEVDGGIGREAFQQVVGTVVRDAGVGGAPVRAYGEMVDLLWQQGNVPAAIELERLWNELIDEERFSLLCAYRSEAVAAPEHALALRDVCRLHTAVSSAEETSRRFQPSDAAPFAARRFLDETLRRWGHGGTVVQDARLLLSELVTNAVVHACSPISVSIRLNRPTLRLSVGDASPLPPVPRYTAGVSPGGRGLQIVAAVATRWGVDLTADGKVVWAEL